MVRRGPTPKLAKAKGKRTQDLKTSSGSGRAVDGRTSKITITNTKTGRTTTTIVDSQGRTRSRSSRKATTRELSGPQLRPTIKTVSSKQLLSTAPRVFTPSGREKALKKQRLAFITASLSKNQEDRLFNSFNSQKQLELFKIESRKDLTPIQKEEKKRNILGIGLSDLQKKVKINEQIRQGVLKGLEKKIQSTKLRNKVITGQSITPSEIKQLNIDINRGSLTKAQLKAARAGIFFGSNAIGGFLETAGEIVIFPAKAILGAVEFGRNAVLRAKKERTSTIKIFGKDLLKLNKTLFTSRKFVQENPKEAFAIAATVATLVGGSLKKSFINDPAKSIGKVLAFAIVPGQIKKLLSKLPAFQPLLESKASRTLITSKQDLVTGKATISGTGNGVFPNGKKFTNSFKLVSNPQTGKITGQIITKIGKKTIKQNIKLIDDGAFYVDSATGLKISKVRIPIVSRKVRIVKETINNIEQTDVINAKFSGKKNVADVLREVINIVDDKRTTTKEISKILQLTKNKKVLAETRKILSIVSKKTKNPIPKQLTQRQINNIEKFLKVIKYNQKTLGEFIPDRRSRVAIALGLRKDSKLINGLESIVDKNGKVIKIIRQKGKAETRAVAKLGEFKVSGKRVQLKLNKKGQTSLVNDDTIKLLEKKGTRFTTKNTITIPRIVSKLPLTKTNLRFYGIIGLFAGLSKTVNQILSTKTQQEFGKINKRVIQLKKDIKTIQEKINVKDKIKIPARKNVTVKKQASIQTTKPVTKTKTVTKQKKKQKLKPIKTRSPTPRTTTPKNPKVKLPLINWDFKKKSNKIQVFNIVFRERKAVSRNFNKKTNPVITKTRKVTTTRNRALNMATQLADFKTIRSIDVKLVGTTKRKLKEVGLSNKIKKFTARKGKTALKFVEKTKFAIDSRGEKKGLKRSRELAKKRKKKRTTKKKKK